MVVNVLLMALLLARHSSAEGTPTGGLEQMPSLKPCLPWMAGERVGGGGGEGGEETMGRSVTVT